MGMRLNWFLPHRKKTDGVGGPFGRVLRLLGATWASSPIRRTVQAACLAVFFVLFLYVCWPYGARPARVRNDRQTAETDLFSVNRRSWSLWEAASGSWPSHYADDLAAKEKVPAEVFLMLDPLVSISTAVAARTWVRSLLAAAGILLVCLVVPRGFCGYVCPLGTLIDLFDWAIGRPIARLRHSKAGPPDSPSGRSQSATAGRAGRVTRPTVRPWWSRLKYVVLAATLVASAFGVLLSGLVSPIAVLTRATMFVCGPLELGIVRSWHQVPPIGWGHYVSLALFCLIPVLGLLRPRFWCKYVCPTGAVFSIGNLLRLTERKVESTCAGCGRCVETCPFDAINPDFTTRAADCAFCQTCGGVCPTGAVEFVGRWNRTHRKTAADPPDGQTAVGRRGFLTTAIGLGTGMAVGVGAAVGVNAFGRNLDQPAARRPVRPPGSVPELAFLQMCVRCGECFQVCPNSVLQPLGFEQGIDGLWTPYVAADWSGCEASCNRCGQVCPTGAIRPLPLREKRAARMGLAIVDRATCLPYAGTGECRLCIDECTAAGYDAIAPEGAGTQRDYPVPAVKAERCVGCGLCQTRCYAINVKSRRLFSRSAIRVIAGGDREDRLMRGSYVKLRQADDRKRREAQEKLRQQERRRLEQAGSKGEIYIPD